MIAQVRSWWRGRTLREQRMLLAMSGLLALVIVWLGVIRPLDAALAEARRAQADAVLALADVRAAADRVTGLARERVPRLDQPVVQALAAAAREAGFEAQRIEPAGGDGATIAIAAVRPQAFFAWIGATERRYGLVVDRLQARPNSDATLSVELVMRARR